MSKSNDPDYEDSTKPPSYNEIYNITHEEAHKGSETGWDGSDTKPGCSYSTRKSANNGIEEIEDENRSQLKRRPNRKSLGKVFYEFTQNTSLHGARLITEPQPFIFRRMFWFLVFLGCSVLLVLQMGLSVQYYLSWPVSVELKIIYNDSIQFPAVTLCNKNAFRTSKAFENGYYYLLHDLYKDTHRTANFSQYKAISQKPLTDIYTDAGHMIEDLVISCEWEGSPCQRSDFVKRLTDYGQCYTFNSGINGTSLKMASTTGSGGGLRLQLNIEQYEYMRGPNEGAGLKILVHNYNEIPLVKDHGVAVPPGSHAFMSVKTTAVHNLVPNHGKCNDSVKLDYFEDYSVASCEATCKLMFVVERCDCKDVYMPGPAPVCTLVQYQDCLVEALETFTQMKGVCDCPVPCDSLMFEPVVSYASTSNFDILALLRKNNTEALAERYLKSREINQKVNQDIVKEDREMIMTFVESITQLNVVVERIKTSLETLRTKLIHQHNIMQQRLNFHLTEGLENVKVILEGNTLRQWQSYFEKNFDHLLFDYKGLPRMLKQYITDANGTVDFTNRDKRILVTLPPYAAIMRRFNLVADTDDFIRQMERYMEGEKVVVTMATYSYHYDEYFISHELLAARFNTLGQKEYEKQYNELMESVKAVRGGLIDLLNVINIFTEDSLFHSELYTIGESKFVHTIEDFRDRLYRYDKQVHELTVTEMNDAILNIKLDNKSQFEIFTNILRKIDTINGSMKSSSQGYLKHAQALTELSLRYLSNDANVTKTSLAEAVSSQAVKESFYALHLFFNDVQLNLRGLRIELQALKISYRNAWHSMVNTPYTKRFYEKVFEDIKRFAINPDEELTAIYWPDRKYDYPMLWFQMLKKWYVSRDAVNRLSVEQLKKAMNADFIEKELDHFLNETELEFNGFLAIMDDAYSQAELDEPFLVAFDKYKASLEEFLSGSVVNSKFYRENFMRVDIFLQELRYEEIRQQKAYDVIKLLGDIGGSMGLFLGASVLSIIEFFDVFVHHGAQIFCRKKNKKKSEATQECPERQKTE